MVGLVFARIHVVAVSTQAQHRGVDASESQRLVAAPRCNGRLQVGLDTHLTDSPRRTLAAAHGSDMPLMRGMFYPYMCWGSAGHGDGSLLRPHSDGHNISLTVAPCAYPQSGRIDRKLTTLAMRARYELFVTQFHVACLVQPSSVRWC
jgi:hypothetical protein